MTDAADRPKKATDGRPDTSPDEPPRRQPWHDAQPPEGTSPAHRVEYSDPVKPEEYGKLAADHAELRASASKVEERKTFGVARQSSKAPQAWMKFSALGIQMAVVMVAPGLLGWWIDTKAGSEPWGLILGCALGGVAGMITVVMSVTRGGSKSKPKDPKPEA